MLSRRAVRGPVTGSFHTPVCTVRPCQATSLGRPTLSACRMAIGYPLGSLPARAYVRAGPRQTGAMVVYKILTADEWASARAAGRFDGSAVDRRDGYVHLSGADQVVETAARHFAGQ